MNTNVRKKKELCLLLYHTSMVQQTVTKEVHAFFISSHFFNTTSLFNSLSANFTKWSNTLKQFVGNLTTNFLTVFDQFVKLALKGLIFQIQISKLCCKADFLHMDRNSWKQQINSVISNSLTVCF